MVEDTVEEFGQIDCVINNAAYCKLLYLSEYNDTPVL